jgi:hypothetical protein
MASLVGLIAESIAHIGYLDAKEAAKENLEMCIKVCSERRRRLHTLFGFSNVGIA